MSKAITLDFYMPDQTLVRPFVSKAAGKNTQITFGQRFHYKDNISKKQLAEKQ